MRTSSLKTIFKTILFHTICLNLLLCVVPLVAFAGGGKQFKEGMKHELAKEWDKAAEAFSLALREEPSNPEYELHFLRAVQNASLMFMNRARLLVEQKDYENAYLAYKQAFSFDPTNEQAKVKMKEMLIKQGLNVNAQGEVDLFNPTKPKEISQSIRPKKILKSYDIPNETVENIIRLIAKQDLRFNVIFDQQSKTAIQTRTKFEMYDISAADALEILLDSNNLTFYRVAPRSIMIATKNNPQLAQRYDENMLKTFYVRNAKIQELQTLITQMLGAGKQVALNTQLNTITVRDTAENLKIIESLINSVDKPQAEVVMDVNIYEILQEDLLQIGNQFVVDSSKDIPQSLKTLGGIGQKGLRANTPAGLFGPIGLSLVLPPSTLSFFQSRGKTKIIAQTQLHSFEGESASVNIGDSVPILTASVIAPTTTTPGTSVNNAYNQVQYRDVGLNISIKPKVIDDLVQMNLEIESSSKVASAKATSTNENPTFTQRKMKGVARVRDGQTTIAASVMSQSAVDSRSGIPILSLIPGIGRLFSTPGQEKNAKHIIITVTPHILRGGAVSEEEEKQSYGPLDFILGANGQQSYGRQLSLEELVEQANKEEQQEIENKVEVTPPVSSSMSTFAPAKAAGVNPSSQPDGIVRPTVPTTPVSQPNVPVTSPTANPTQPTTPLSKPAESPSTGSTKPETAPATPVPIAIVVSPSTKPQIGQIITVATIASSSSTKISAASLYLHYNPAVLKVVTIRDGGLLQPGNFQSRDEGGQVFASTILNASKGSVSAAGQLVAIDFQVIGAGAADFRMDVIELKNSEQQPIPISFSAMPNVTAVGNQ